MWYQWFYDSKNMSLILVLLFIFFIAKIILLQNIFQKLESNVVTQTYDLGYRRLYAIWLKGRRVCIMPLRKVLRKERDVL